MTNEPAVKRHPIRKFFLIIFGTFTLIMLAGAAILANQTPEERAKIAADKKSNEDKDSAAELGAKAVQHAAADEKTKPDARTNAAFNRVIRGAASIRVAMRHPDSLKFSDVQTMPDGVICYSYRAQNGFGGMNIENAALTTKGKLWSHSASVWHGNCGGTLAVKM